MTTQIKVLLALILATAVALGVTLYDGDDTDLLDTKQPEVQQVIQPPEPVPVLKGQDVERQPNEIPKQPVRMEAAPDPASGAEYEQGVLGTVVDQFGTPVQGAKVYLMPGLGFRTMQMFRQHQEGVRFQALAMMETEDDAHVGRARLGRRRLWRGERCI